MKFKASIIFLFLALNSLIVYSQNRDTLCSCLLIKESEENDAKVVELAELIETSFLEGENKGFNDNFDIQSFLNSVTKNLKIDKDDEYTSGFLQGAINTGDRLSEQILESVNSGTYYNFISYKYNLEDMAYYFTFRIYSEAEGINYHDYKVCSDGETVNFNDIYIYLTGENLSTTLNRVFLLGKPKSSLFGTKNNNSILSFLEAKKHADKGQFEKAYNKLDEIKGAMAKERFILLIKIIYASSFNDTVYEKTLKEFATLYPNDPTLYLKQVDYNLLKGNYDAALANIDQLMSETHDDFTNLLKGNIYLVNEDYENAEKHYKYMTTNYEDVLEGHIGYMVSLNYQDRFEEVLKSVITLLDQGYDKEEFLAYLEEKEPDGSNALEKFVNSEVYKTWKKES